MRHAIAGNRLNRKSSHRKATVRDIAKSALIHERICTTKAKAKEARKLVDQLITMGKKGTLAEKRRAFAILCDHKLVSDLFSAISVRFKERQGGYTRIIPIGTRKGDSAELVYLELTEKKEVVLSKQKVKAGTKKETLKAADKKGKTKTAPKKPKTQAQKPEQDKADTKAKENEPEPTTHPESDKKHGKKDVIEPKKGNIGKKISGFKKFFNKKSSGNK
jgi:large subunit ribosomal protein L17